MQAGQYRTVSILLAEDNLVNQKMMLLMLRKMGLHADVAVNGIEVLRALERQSYDIVLMDIQMPEIDGIEATRTIRQRWPNNGPYIIAITAMALNGAREICLDAGMDDYVSKPVSIEDLRSVLDLCLAAKKKANAGLPRSNVSGLRQRKKPYASV